MNPRKLVPLVFLLGILVILAFVFGRREPKKELGQEAGFVPLAPPGFVAGQVGRLEVYRGGRKEKGVLIEKEASGWRVKSYFNGPGDGERVSLLLKELGTLEGEFRVSDPSVLGDFDLTEDKAVHLVLYRQGSGKPWWHLLLGKSLPNGEFVRQQGEDPVYLIDRNLRRDLGFFGEDARRGVEQTRWVDKTILEFKEEEVHRLSMEWPDRKCIFERRKKGGPSPGGAEGGGGPQEGAGAREGFEWVVAGRPGPFPLKEKVVGEILAALSRLRAVDIVDPKEKEEKGLDAPPFRCTIAFAGGGTKTLVASHPDPLQDGYMVIEGGDGTVYRVSRYTFDRVFRKGADLFEIPSFSIDGESIRTVSLSSPEKTLVLEKTGGGEFRVLRGSVEGGQDLNKRGEVIWETLDGLSPADFVEALPEADRGLEAPPYQVTVSMKGGKRHVLSFGKRALGLPGRYMKIDDNPTIFVIGKADLDRLFP
ncbi:MAG: DUF4340 domain-containing protein [Deltaproteobacteria bacterium]|nr:DUF4340 domain-containing protein [Deltaproteobacteria bacterium]